MNSAIAELSGHTIICGGGMTGEYILRELAETNRPYVLIESSPGRIAELEEMIGREFPYVVGDATDDSSLEAAGIGNALGLIACLDSDRDNLSATGSARRMNQALRIVCRCIDERSEDGVRADLVARRRVFRHRSSPIRSLAHPFRLRRGRDSRVG